MKNTELGPTARPPADSERATNSTVSQWCQCGRIELRAPTTGVVVWPSDGITGADGVSHRNDACVPRFVVGQLVITGRERSDRQTTFTPATGGPLRAALGEARGTASGSESPTACPHGFRYRPECPECSLDIEPLNSEQGALRASLDDRQALEHVYPCCDEPFRFEEGGGALPCPKHGAEAITRLVDRKGDAPTAPPDLPETAPPAPDLLPENARLRAHLTQKVRAIEKMQGACTDYVERLRKAALRAEAAEEDRDYFKASYSRKLDDEKRALEAASAAVADLTRAHAAHLENATLLAKAKGRVESVIRDALRALREVQESGDVDPEEVGGEINRVEHMLLGCLPAGETWPIPTAAGTTPDERKGDAAQPPLNPASGDMKHKDSCPWGPVYNECTCVPAAPAKEGK